MKLSLLSELAAAYKSGCQISRVVTEAWGEENLYCPNCTSPRLSRQEHNTRATDFICPNCAALYQLKASRSPIGVSIVDGAFSAMMAAIRRNRTPNLLLMHYDLNAWNVRNLLLIPHFAFPASAIIKRKPLSEKARRAGWVGCNIALTRIPIEARISIIANSQIVSEEHVRTQYRRVRPLEKVSSGTRGWALDVLTAARSIKKQEFTNEDLYVLETHFQKIHPENRHIRQKIRQQLQVLRDAKLLVHVEPGHWRFTSAHTQ